MATTPIKEPTSESANPHAGYLAGASLAAILLAFCYAFHTASPALLGVDGYFHIKYSQLLGKEGLIRDFPWLAFTIYSRDFADDHFLFHLLMVPFTFGNLITGAKIYASTITLFVFLFFFWLLRRHQIRYPFLWSIVLLFSAPLFLFRLSMLRAAGISLLFLLIATALILERKDRWVAPLAFLYVWLYGGFPLLIVLVCIACSVSWWFTKKARLGLFMACGLGTLDGLVLHPYFPDNIQFLYTSYTQIELGRFPQSVLVGGEDYPYAASTAVRKTLLVWALLFATLLFYLLRSETLNAESLMLFLFSVVLLCLYLKVRRYVEYWPAFALLFTAWALNPWLNSLDLKKNRHWVAVFFLVIGLAGYHTYTELLNRPNIYSNHRAYEGAARYLKENTPEGTLVFTADWDDFPLLFHFNTHNRYIVGLGLPYLYLYDPDLYSTWLNLSRGHDMTPALTIVEEFGAQYVFSLNADHDFSDPLGSSAQAKVIYEDDHARVFYLRAP